MADVLLQAQTTTRSRADAEKLAGEMVSRRLAACAQVVGPIRSMYWWDDSVQNDDEYLILFKTREKTAEQFKRELAEMHEYDVPEIIFVEIRDGSRAYLDWINHEVQPSGPTQEP